MKTKCSLCTNFVDFSASNRSFQNSISTKIFHVLFSDVRFGDLPILNEVSSVISLPHRKI